MSATRQLPYITPPLAALELIRIYCRLRHASRLLHLCGSAPSRRVGVVRVPIIDASRHYEHCRHADTAIASTQCHAEGHRRRAQLSVHAAAHATPPQPWY